MSEAKLGLLKLSVRDFKGLKHVEWSPNGVCGLAGPNGSGKSSLLEALLFLRDLYEHGISQAIRRQRGAVALRRTEAEGAPEIVLGLEAGSVRWELRLSVGDGSVNEFPGESVTAAGEVLLRRAAFAQEWYFGRERRTTNFEGRTCLRLAYDAMPEGALAPLVEAIRSYSVYSNYALGVLRDGGTGSEDDQRLSSNGQNLFLVLRNWQTAPRRFRNQFEWVVTQMRSAFPGILEHIEFDPPVGQIVPARFFPSGSETAFPMSRAADGMLVGLLHLAAVAGAKDGAIVAIEEMENQLHPHAIRSILRSMRELADERNLTILLTTHSPVLMNEFKGHEGQFYILEAGHDVLPVPLDEARDPDWLAHFSLGDLYDREDFAAPTLPGA